MATERAPQFRFGTPTAYDATDRRYQETLRLETLQGRLGIWPTSTSFLHNHVAAATRYSGLKMDFDEMKRMYQTGQIGARHDSKELRGVLRPQLILQNQIDQVVRFQEAIAGAEPYLGEIKKDCTTKSSHRISPLPDGVKETSLSNDKDRMEWAYKFNPWELTNRELASLRADLEALDVKGDPIEALGKIWSVVHAHDESSARKLSELYLHIPVDRFSFSFEDDRGSGIGKLAAINKDSASGSDVSIRFDGRYLHIREDEKTTQMIPFEPLWNPEARNSSHGLKMRIAARDSILKLMEEKGSIVINGIRISRNEQERMIASKTPADWLVDTLGESIEAPDAILEPGDWRVEELKLIAEYRSISVKDALRRPFHPVVKKIISSYTGFFEEGLHFNPEEIVSDVLDVIRCDDWEKVFNPKKL